MEERAEGRAPRLRPRPRGARDPPIDSSNVNPACWARDMRRRSRGRYEDLRRLRGAARHRHHGLHRLGALVHARPVWPNRWCSPGSQLPIGEIREDGTENLITALQIAAARTDAAAGSPMVQEVAISFGQPSVARQPGDRRSAPQISAPSNRSITRPLAEHGPAHRLQREAPARSARYGQGRCCGRRYAMDDAVSRGVLSTRVSPRAVLRLPAGDRRHVKALVLRTFGAGNAPTESWFTASLWRDTVRRGKGGRERDPVPCGRCGGGALRHR